MKNYSLSSRKLDRYMRKVLDICGTKQSVQLDRDFAPSPEFLRALHILEASKEIECRYPLGSDVPYFIRVLPDGTLHFYAKGQRRAGFWRGFFSGLVLGLVPVVIQYFLPDITVNVLSWLQRLRP